MYENYYKLTAKPFRLTPDPRFLFVSRVHKRALAYLRYGLSQGEGFVVITGHVGAGKTTLLRTLISEMGDDVIAAELVATPMSAKDVVEHIGAALGISYESTNRTAILKRVEAHLKSRIEEGIRVVLMVDEAQNLNMAALEELRMLANMEHNGRPYLQVFLVGQEEFKATLQGTGMEQFRQRVIASYHLSPMDQDEIKGYVIHRLQRVGWAGDPEFTAESFSEIHAYSGGVPRRINTLCDRLMLFGFLEERHVLDSAAVKQVADELREEIKAQGLDPDTAQLPEAAEGHATGHATGDTAGKSTTRQTAGSTPIQLDTSATEFAAQGLAAQFTQLGKVLETVLVQSASQSETVDKLSKLERRLEALEARLAAGSGKAQQNGDSGSERG